MIVTLATEGLVVQDADDCERLHLQTALDDDALQVALRDTGSGVLGHDGKVWLDLATLRVRAQLAATIPDWEESWTAMLADARRRGRISADGDTVRVDVER